MICLFPINIPRPNGKGNADRIDVPCGKCAACLTNRRTDWTLRLSIEMEYASTAHFITLTYSDENIYYNKDFKPSVYKKDMQDYMKRIRKHCPESKIRYYLVGEYGTQTKRPHYHILLFNYPLEKLNRLESLWNNGHILVGNVSMQSISYVCKYHVNSTNFPEGSNPSFTLMSRNPGIGYPYLTKMGSFHDGRPEKGFYYGLSGEMRRLPRYFKDKLYSKEEKRFIPIKNANSDQTQLDYEALNPTENYFKYSFEQKIDFQKRFKEKINKTNKF